MPLEIHSFGQAVHAKQYGAIAIINPRNMLF